jgi:hypothetical protein
LDLRAFYEMGHPPESPQAGSDARVRRFLQLSVIAFWVPSAGYDLLLLWREQSAQEFDFVFWLLFREAIVFLALWFTVSIAHGLMRGRRTREPTRRQRRVARSKLAPFASVGAPSRYTRGQ